MIHILRELGFDYSEGRELAIEAVKELAQLKGLDVNSLHVPQFALLSLSAGLTNLMVKEFNASEVPWIYRARPLYIGNVNGTQVAIIWAAPGAPLAAMVMEHLIACGAKYVIGLGLLASIQPEIDVGTIVIPSRAIRGEGTSYYYLPPEAEAQADETILNALREACRKHSTNCIEGTIYTTDAIHRETPKLINALRNRGVIGIDMETSAILAVGKSRNIKTACILVTSTSPKRKSLGFYSETLNESLHKAIRITKTAVTIIAKHK